MRELSGETMTVEWSDEDAEWVATTSEYPSLSWLAATPDEAAAGLRRLVDEVRQEMS